MFTWWKRLGAPRSKAPAQRYRPTLEGLEERAYPATAVGPASFAINELINVSQAGGNDTQQSTAINPRNTNQVVVVANSDASASGIFEAWSDDGGVTWNTQYLFNDTTLPDEAAGDAQVAWDRFGNLFVTYLTTSGDVAIALSTDGGQTFGFGSYTRPLILTSNGTAAQPSIAVGQGPRANLGSVWVSYNDSTPVPPRVIVQRAVVAGLALVGPFNNPGYVAAFGDPSVVPGSDATNGNFGDIAIGPNGQALVTYMSTPPSAPPDGPSVIWVNLDPDGLGRANFGTRRAVTSTNVGGTRRPPAPLIFPAQSNVNGIDAEPSLAWDRSNGPNRGRVYIVYVDAPTSLETDFNTDIYMRFSDNNGVTWSPRRLINTDGGTASQFNPAISCDPTTGAVAISWYDTRNSPAAFPNRLADNFFTLSVDGGATFIPERQLSTGSSDSRRSEPAVNGVDLGFGSYNKIDFTGGVLQLSWSDNSSYIPLIPPPPAPAAQPVPIPFNPDVNRMDIATRRVLVAPALRVNVYFPARWTPINAAAGLYTGQLRILNTSGVNLNGPFQLTITVPSASITFPSPANTQVGTKVTFTIASDLPNGTSVPLTVQLSNPLKVKLPRILIGYATEIFPP